VSPGPPQAATRSRCTVRVVIPAHNERHHLEPCLRPALVAARERGWELVVVDDGSSDGSGDLARGMGAQVLRNEQPTGVAAARNLGARGAGTDLLLFLDADIVAPPETLFLLVDHLEEHPAVHTVGAAPALSDLSPGWGPRFVGLRAAMPFLEAKRSDIAGFSAVQSECCAFRREAFEALGGFPELHRGVGMEEYRMGHALERAGYVNLLLVQATYQHFYKPLGPRCRELVRRTSRWVPLLLQRRRLESDGAVGSPRETLSCALSGLLLASLMLAPLLPPMAGLSLVALALQLMIEARFLALAQRSYGPGMVLFAWPALQACHMAVMLGFGLGLVRAALAQRVSET
jgi:GT2 family glycosyltransferase